MKNIKRYIIPDAISDESLMNKIAEIYPVTEGKKYHRNLEYYDTFDWRLYKKNMFLQRDEKGYGLLSLDEKRIIASSESQGRKHFKFWSDFPDGAMKKKLKPVIGVRALLSVAAIKREIKDYKISGLVDSETISMAIEDFKLREDEEAKSIARVLSFNSKQNVLSGHAALKKLFIDSDITLADDIYLRCLTAARKTAGDYSSKIKLTLDPQMPSSAAVKIVLRALFDVMLKNEEGVRKNTDIEFLHDYRVAVRKTRTVLGQLKNVFPPQIKNEFKNEFAALGKLTNSARDLDVYLLKDEEYEKMLPDYFKGTLEPLFVLLKKKRRAEQTKIVRAFKNESYDDFKKSYSAFLDDETAEIQSAVNSDVPIGKLATEAILRRYDQVIEYGNKLTKKSPDKALHKLRIKCKKLRYLLELFASLYPPKKIEFLILQLKKLQTGLGDFNDMIVQQEFLCGYLDNVSSEEKISVETAAAVGGLITRLHCEKEKAGKRVKKTFVQFHNSSKKIKKSLDVF